ncbi:MAG TPA: DUF456 domain-containing protein [Spirochaeta sp.]|nr:DUF456 domain-containing protein [Spirochaeta sp.]
MITEIIFTIAGSILIIIGFIGCVAPVLPGPVLSFAALILISIPTGFGLFKPVLLIILGAAAVISQLLDNVFPVISSKRAGAGRAGIWGSIVGMIAGMIFLPPLGVIIGAFLGALAGEMLFNRENDKPLKAALGVFTGTLLGVIVKLTVSGIITAFFIKALLY